ncbi:Hypothetical predicted protein [Paramuricea clavata]|uniref:Uncharacterized protein n=1 Tax=Paramuricea clavata TaxID=317549 RepID=A0A7D9EH60_PARCT|nr:Hypothetical predicted protein [Paramuricea clavata]
MAPTKGESVDDSSLEIESVATRRGRRSKKETGASAALKKIKQSRESGEKVKYEVSLHATRFNGGLKIIKVYKVVICSVTETNKLRLFVPIIALVGSFKI